MYELTLLERIEALESVRKEPLGENSIDIALGSIMAHLRKLLNTNMGSVQIASDYGMPDMIGFSDDSLSDTIEKVEKAVLATVKKYEKRLSQVKIKIKTDETAVLNIHFSLEGVLARQENVPVFFESVVQTGGRISIKK
ncbi:MAG: type VI secretion system baseplate subunit TssE [Desulfobacteraceae bacterium]|nr:type VI secretion system baseplate subunit TssE [Desulfobacteraceae bacterium]